MTEIFQNSLFPTKKNVFPLVPEANNLPFSFFDQQASNIHIQNFQNFLKLVKDIFTSKTEENFINTLENLKTPYYKLENSQDLQEIYQLYINTYFPSSQKKKSKKKWKNNEITFLSWTICYYSIYFKKDIDTFIDEDWKTIANLVPDWDINKIRFKWFSIQKSIEQKTPWSVEEDQKLGEIIKKIEMQEFKKESLIYKWTEIAEELNCNGIQGNATRLGKHCRERWFNHLDSKFKKGEWTLDEDYLLIKLISQNGKKWSLISKNIGYRNENSVKNRYFSLKRKYTKIYRNSIPQSEKKMLSFIMQKLKPENFLEVSIKNIENQNPLKKIKPNPIHLKKQGLTLELKKNPNHHPKLLIDHNSLLSKKSSHFRQTQSSLMNPNSNSESKVIKLNSNETSLIPSLFVPEEIDTSEISNIKKDNIQEEEEEKNIPMEQQPRSAFTRKSSHKSHTESKNISPRQKKRSIDFSFQQENELLEMPENLEYYEIPNMYKERTENLKKSNLFYPNKDSFYLLKMPFNIIKEESLPYDMSNELSHYLSSLSLSDQYIIEGNRILSGLNLNQNPNSSISISKIITDSFQNANTPKMITESFNRSNTKHHTFTITNSSEKSSKILENNSFIKTSNALEDHLNYNNRRTSMSYFKNPNLINNNNNDLINRANPIQKCLHQKILTCESISSNCQMASLMNNNDESINSNFQNNDNGNNFNRKITCLPSTESILSLRAVNTNVDMIGELSNNYLKSEIEDFSAQEFLNMGK